MVVVVATCSTPVGGRSGRRKGLVLREKREEEGGVLFGLCCVARRSVVSCVTPRVTKVALRPLPIYEPGPPQSGGEPRQGDGGIATTTTLLPASRIATTLRRKRGGGRQLVVLGRILQPSSRAILSCSLNCFFSTHSCCLLSWSPAAARSAACIAPRAAGRARATVEDRARAKRERRTVSC